MKKMLFLAVLLFVSTAAPAQTERRIYTQAELEGAKEREAQKKMQDLQDSIAYVQALDALERLDFVLEADMLQFRRGETAFVSTSTNFISLSDDKAVVQIAPFNGGGPNGVGGITLEGRASNIKIKTDRKGNTYFTMNVMGTGLSATVDVSLTKGSNRASITVSPNLHGNRVSLYGNLYPSARSRIIEGRSL